MTAVLLELDDAFDRQTDFIRQVPEVGHSRLWLRDLGPSLRLWSKDVALGEVRSRLYRALGVDGPRLVFMGSGDFHHLSALLIERAVALSPERPLTVLHFDNHPDWVHFSPGLHCGSWAARVARFSGVRRILTIGPCSPDILDDGRKGADLSVVHEGLQVLFPLGAEGKEECVIAGRPVPTIEALGDALFLDRIRTLIGTDDIYITIDKDVLSPLDADTNWDQGNLRLDRMLSWIRALSAGLRLRGADISGDGSTPDYGPGLRARLLKWVEARLDQPLWSARSNKDQGRNSAANIAIYACLAPLISRGVL